MSAKKIKNDSIVLKTFRKKTVIVVDQILKLLNSSITTARRRLNDWDTYTSYNKNGRYYVLPDIPKFDQNGLWHYKDIFFSKYGSLKKTVINIVNNSQCGLTSIEIEKIVCISTRTFLSHLQNEPQLIREKIGGRFVYFSSNKVTLKKQKQKRMENTDESKIIKNLSDTDAIAILVERIKYPQLDIEQLSVKLRRKEIQIKPEAARLLFEKHGLLKKTQNMQNIPR